MGAEKKEKSGVEIAKKNKKMGRNASVEKSPSGVPDRVRASLRRGEIISGHQAMRPLMFPFGAIAIANDASTIASSARVTACSAFQYQLAGVPVHSKVAV